MNSYSQFAEYYDLLMKEDINYSHIADFIENLFIKYDIAPELVCDLACGTGNITVPLAKRGYDMTGVDASSEMLDIAKKKSLSSGLDILYLSQSIAKLDLFGTYGAFLCMIDGINYIIDPNRLFYMFSRIKKCFMDPGGIFIFDISSYKKLSETIGNNTFIRDGDDIFYTWENKFHKNHSLSEMYLNFFIGKKHGYRRFSEHHLQRAYKTDEIVYYLKKAGFKSVDIFGGYSFAPPNENSKRIVFAAR